MAGIDSYSWLRTFVDMLQNIDEEIKRIVRDFVHGTLGSIDTKCMCFNICYPLHIYLKTKGVENDLSCGEVSGRYHFWLTMGKEIIDPTASQFSALNCNEIYFGKLRVDKYDVKELKPDSYVEWKKHLHKDDKRNALIVSLKAGLLLLGDIQQNGYHDPELQETISNYLSDVFTASLGLPDIDIVNLFSTIPDKQVELLISCYPEEASNEKLKAILKNRK